MWFSTRNEYAAVMCNDRLEFNNFYTVRKGKY